MSGHYENVDGHRVWTETPAVAPAERLPSATSDQVALGSVPADLAVDVHPGYCMRPDTIALHFPLTAVPALCALFPTEAGKIHAAALLVEQEAEWESDRLRGRQLTGGGA